jgi:hypothetical protein
VPQDRRPGATSENIAAGQALTAAVGLLQAMGAGGAASSGRQPGGPRHERGAGAAAGEAPLHTTMQCDLHLHSKGSGQSEVHKPQFPASGQGACLVGGEA